MKTMLAIIVVIALFSIPVLAESEASTEAVAVSDLFASVGSETLATDNFAAAMSWAEAIGNIISVYSSSTATGLFVYGSGEAIVQADVFAGASVETSVQPLDSGLNSLTITASGAGVGNAEGEAWTFVYGGNIPWEDVINPPPQVVQPVVQERAGFFGYTFGKCDVQRYKHFWLQMRNNNTEDDARALMHMEILATGLSNRWGTMAMSDLENRYNITDRNPPDGLDGNGDKNGKWCILPSNGNITDGNTINSNGNGK